MNGGNGFVWMRKGWNTEASEGRSGPQEKRKLTNKNKWRRRRKGHGIGKEWSLQNHLGFSVAFSEGLILGLASTNLPWIWSFFISKTAGSFCESSKRTQVKQKGARRRLPVSSLALAMLAWPMPNGAHGPETQTHVLAIWVPHHPFDSAEQPSFLFRAHLASLAPLWFIFPYPVPPLSPLHTLGSFSYFLFQFCPPDLIFNSVPWLWSQALLLSPNLYFWLCCLWP